MDDQLLEFAQLGDGALSVKLSDDISEETNDAVLDLCNRLDKIGLPGIIEIQPAYSSLAVHFDQGTISAAYIKKVVVSLCLNAEKCISSQRKPNLIEIPVRYGGDAGPDLAWASEYLNLPEEEIIKRHCSRLYRVYMIGFTPGFPYLGGMDESISLPRLPEPRKRVPRGSVGIAGNQTGIYPWDTPGGWRIIGRTDCDLFSLDKDPPSLLKPGDYVRFVPAEHFFRDEDTTPADTLNSSQVTGGTGSQTEPSGSDSKMNWAIDGLFVDNPGILTLVVDRGRFGYRRFGVPTGGAADLRSYALANALCGNNSNEACLEFTLRGPTLVAQTELTVAVTGAPAPVRIDGQRVPSDTLLLLREGQTLDVGEASAGLRGYIAVSGGIQVPIVLGSKSTYLASGFGGYLGRQLKYGDTLQIGPAPSYRSILESQKNKQKITKPLDFRILDAPCVFLHIHPGPESSKPILSKLTSTTYEIRPDSDRMGARLDGPRLLEGGADIISAPCVIGTIQISSDGRPMLLLCDSQTTGGYMRAATLLTADLPIASQLRPGNKVRFRLIPNP